MSPLGLDFGLCDQLVSPSSPRSRRLHAAFAERAVDSPGAVTPRPLGQLRRAGHTLIEILLALGLSLVILTAAYAALDQHWRYVETGQRQTERMQVTRALFERLSLDLRSVMFHRDARFAPPSGLAGTPRAALGIVGDGQKLLLQVDVPTIEGAGGVQTIRWEMHALETKVPGDHGVPDRGAGTAQTLGSRTFGLARIVRRDTALEAAQAGSPTDLLAPEVETIRFRYYAGGSWTDRWDSVQRQELPRAVEITIGFRSADAAVQTQGETDPGAYRLIVPVPASEA